MAVFQEGEEDELKSENILTKNSPLLREAQGPLAWAFSENEEFGQSNQVKTENLCCNK